MEVEKAVQQFAGGLAVLVGLEGHARSGARVSVVGPCGSNRTGAAAHDLGCPTPVAHFG
jgi:predicted ABC-type transport system involved in lysophospholipase L1 biosynthesis ATPase subunit